MGRADWLTGGVTSSASKSEYSLYAVLISHVTVAEQQILRLQTQRLTIQMIQIVNWKINFGQCDRPEPQT